MTTAYWCVLAAVFLPYACFGIAVNTARRAGVIRDNHYPRDLSSHLNGAAKRAWGAHLNSFESLPGFAAAVIIAHLVQAPQFRVDTLALVWVVARVAFVAFYMTDKPTPRSLSQFVSLGCVLGLFIAAGMAA